MGHSGLSRVYAHATASLVPNVRVRA